MPPEPLAESAVAHYREHGWLSLGQLLDAEANPVLVEARAPGERALVPLREGEGVAFTGLTLHGSGPNRSGAPRPAFFVRYCEPHARMMSEGGRPVLEDPHSWMVAGKA